MTFIIETRRMIFSVLLASIVLIAGDFMYAFADVIIDNGDPGTSFTGIWSVSGGADPWDPDDPSATSVWSRDGSTYTWAFTPMVSGAYELSMWWAQYASRSSNIPVLIEFSGGTDTVTVNQQVNGGRWNLLGLYNFVAGVSYDIRITSQPGPTSTCADAVRFVPVSTSNYTITATAGSNGTITPSGNVTVIGGNDQGFSIRPNTGYRVDDVLVDGSSVGSVTSYRFTNVTANHTISVSFDADDAETVIIDNGDPGTSYTGTWSVSSAAGWYGTESLWSRDGSIYRWAFTPSVSGSYNVAMWWTEWSSRSTSVPVIIEHAAGSTPVTINQRLNGSRWNSLGVFNFRAGTRYQIRITAQPGPSSTCADAVQITPASPPSPTELMFIFPGYASIDATADLSSLLRDMGAIEESGAWKYRISAQNKDVEIRIGNSIEEMNQALMTEDAHVLYFGHSNYGLGALFATPSEFSSQVVDDILFIDDDRIFNYSSEWVHVNIRGMRTGQAYPFWWPIFKDGSSGIMPYDFGDPLGDPVFNYYVTYQVPGDPTHYKIENVRNGAIERFPDWGGPAWYSPNGSKPNSSNPEDQQYFITNPEPWEPSVEVIGGWQESQTFPGYYLENYIYAPAGRGDVQVRWMFDIPAAGYYKVQAWWSSSTGRSTNAPYTIYHSNPSTLADNNTTIRVNQRLNGARWNELGEFFFDVGEYFVMLTDDTTTGTVVGDAIRVEHVDNPSEVLSADFNARVRSGVAPLEVTFESTVIGQVSGLHWDFGDGATNNTRDYISHVYDQPGIYSVSFTVSGPLGTDRVTKAGYIVVAAGSEPEPILRAEFSARSSREGVAPFEAGFRDRSSGNIISWLWDFGDGHSSEEQNPVHLYEADGIYTVKLTVTDANGSATSTETKPEFIRVNIYDKTVDNVDYPKTHYRSKTLLFVNNLDIDPADLKYSRLLYVGCDSGHYFTDTFKRGKMFYALNTSSTGDLPILVYLRSYLEGKTDHEIWQDLQNLDPIFDYFDFDRPPTAQPVNLILSSSEPRAFAVEPMQADVNYTLDEEKEKTIQDLGDLSISMAFDRLGSVDILSDEKFLDKAIYYAFQHRQKASVAFALNAMKQDLYQPSQSGGAINRGIDFYVAEQIFKMFPDEAIDPLLKLYQNGDPITRANVVRASGVIANHPSIYQLLITALDDEDFFEEVEGVESIGNPMRVCDHAYNQIVLKYQIKSVLRTISSAHRVERRDNHIEILKKVLQEHNRQ